MLGSLAKEAKLLDVLQRLELLPKYAQGFDAPPLSAAQVAELASKLDRGVLPAGILDSAVQRTGAGRELVLEALVQQLHHVVVFATSDGGGAEENVRGVERLIRSGGVELFSAA